MSCTVVVGGQYGSEGKGKVVALTASLKEAPWVVRCGGPNSGHSTNVQGREVILRQIPAAAGHPNALLLLAAGCALSEEVVLKELDLCELPPERVVIDPRAVLVTKADLDADERITRRFAPFRKWSTVVGVTYWLARHSITFGLTWNVAAL